LAKLTIIRAHTWKNMHLRKHTLAKQVKKQLTNGERLNQTHCSYYEKRKTKKYNVIFMWAKDLTWTLNITLNLFLFCINFK